MKDDINSEVSNKYWNEMRLADGFSCPNVATFRFIGTGGINLQNKKVLEIGFGANRGQDLIECQTRGAKVYGVDINESYLEYFKKNHPTIQVKRMDAGTEEYSFGINFDLIFHRDVIYYLTNDQIAFHLKNSYQNLMKGGHLIFQFIEKDIMVNREKPDFNSYKTDFDLLKKSDSNKIFRGDINPIRKLDIDWLISQAQSVGFKLNSTKTVIESYTRDESVYRVDRYLLFEK